MTPSMGIELEHTTERILNLTLQIIYLLTGEEYELVKKTSVKQLDCSYGHQASPPSIVLPSPCLTTERSHEKKILEVTNKIIQLLTGKVPIRCQDVTIYFSMEEWQYIEGHKDLYKDSMMENQPPLTSPDESSDGKQTERCTSPLYSQDTKQGQLDMPHHCQGEELIVMKVEVKDEGEEISYVRSEQVSVEEGEIAVKIKEEEEMYVRVDQQSIDEVDMMGTNKEKEEETYVRSDQLSTEEGEITVKIKEEEEEETWVIGDEQSMEEGDILGNSKEEESSGDVSTDGHEFENPSEDLMLSPDYFGEDGSPTQCSPEENSTDPSNIGQYSDLSHRMSPDVQPRFDNVNGSSVAPNPMESTADHLNRAKPRDYIFHYFSEYDQYQKGHTRKRPFTCTECGKSFTCRSHLVIHQRHHTGERPFSCSECGKGFTSRAQVVRHQRVHNEDRPYSCSECGKAFKDKSVFMRHMKIHTRSSDPENGQNPKHKAEFSSGEAPFSCSECGKGFSLKESLDAHVETHASDKPFSCSHCGKCFRRNKDLLRHKRSHTGERPFSCSQCGKCFIRKGHLLIHLKSHTGERPYSCSECGKSFASKAGLIVHERRHTGQRPFSCSECGKCFFEKGNLLKHQIIHTGERSFSCSECGKCFTQKASLIRHERLHTGERPFACLKCGKCFIEKGNLLSHQKIHI